MNDPPPTKKKHNKLIWIRIRLKYTDPAARLDLLTHYFVATDPPPTKEKQSYIFSMFYTGKVATKTVHRAAIEIQSE